MYAIFVIVLMVVLPVVSIAAEYFLYPAGAGFVFLVGKWFVFWAVGARLFGAGLMQTLRPSFTSSGIFGNADPNAEKLVEEIGFGNLAIGLLGLLTIFNAAWIVPAAITGMVFLGLAGAKHVLNMGKSGRESLAMWSDLAIAVVLAAYLVAVLVGARSA